MNLLDAARRVARHYPGGNDALALRLGKSPSTMEKELRGAQGFKLGAEDASEMSVMAHDVGSPHALDFVTELNKRVGLLVVPLPPAIDLDGPQAMQAIAGMSIEAANAISEACQALADHGVCDNELRRFDAALAKMVSAGQAVRALMAGINQAGKPAQMQSDSRRP